MKHLAEKIGGIMLGIAVLVLGIYWIYNGASYLKNLCQKNPIINEVMMNRLEQQGYSVMTPEEVRETDEYLDEVLEKYDIQY